MNLENLKIGKLKKYEGDIGLGGPLTHSGDGTYPLMQAHDIMVDEDDNRLDQALLSLKELAESNIGEDSPPIPVESADEMNEYLANATEEDIGKVYKYNGSSTTQYKQGELYILTHETSSDEESKKKPAGISKIRKLRSEGLVDYYTIALTDGSSTTYEVTNGAPGEQGVGIESIAKTAISGLIDTYTITLTNGERIPFTVTNGAKGDTGVGISSIEKIATNNLTDTYEITYTDGTTSTYEVTNGADGVGIYRIAKTSTNGLVDTYTITLTNGSQSTFEVTNGNDGGFPCIEDDWILSDQLSMLIDACNSRGIPANKRVYYRTSDGSGEFLIQLNPDEDSNTVAVRFLDLNTLQSVNALFTRQTLLEEVINVSTQYAFGMNQSVYQTKTESRLKTENKEVFAAINELNAKTIDKVVGFSTTEQSHVSVDTDEYGISWVNEFAFLDEKNEPIHQGAIHQNIPLAPGENVNFVVETDSSGAKVVKVNAEGGIGADGRGIVSIDLTKTVGRTKTYTITYTDNTTSTFTVMDGATGAQGVGLQVVTTSGTGSAYTASVSSITSLKAGATFIMVPHTNSTFGENFSVATLNVNSLGAKEIWRRRNDSSNSYSEISDGFLMSGKPYRVMYDGMYWVLLDYPKLNANDLTGRVPTSNGGVPTTSATNAGKVLTTNESGTPEWQEPSSPSSDESMIGEWLFNDEITVPQFHLVADDWNDFYICNGKRGNAIYSYDSDGNPSISYFNSYDGDEYTVYVNHSWIDSKYKNITIISVPSSEASAWIKANATKLVVAYQPMTDNTLETDSKEIVSAINELNKNTVDKICGINFRSGGLIDIEPADDGIYFGYEETEIETLTGEYYNINDISSKIPIAAGEGITFEVDEENQVVKINATGSGSGENSGDDSVVGTWVFNDVLDVTSNSFTSNVKFTYGGGSPEQSQIIVGEYAGPGFTDHVLCYGSNEVVYSTYPGVSWSNEAYKTITITEEPTDETFIDWLKANATKQEETPSDTSSGMPQIRFVGMPCSGWLGDVEWEQFEDSQDITQEVLKFTVEIVSGKLQVGDAVQICRMNSYGWSTDKRGKYHPKKRKLRRLFEYVITEEDLKKRFITLEAPLTDKTRKLFVLWDSHGVNDKSLYFRIRRAKGEINSGNNGGGMTVDAEFSNVVSVRCLSYAYWSIYNDNKKFYQIRIT